MKLGKNHHHKEKKCKHSGESQAEVSNLGGFRADLTRKKCQDYLYCQMLCKYKSTTGEAARGGNAATHSSCFAPPPTLSLSPPCKVTPETALLDQYILWDFKNVLIKNMLIHHRFIRQKKLHTNALFPKFALTITRSLPFITAGCNNKLCRMYSGHPVKK